MDLDEISSRRDRKVANKRRIILDHAAQLFAEKGFHRTTTRDIALASDISEGSLYNYFTSKDDILLGIMQVLADAQQDELSSDMERIFDARALLIEALTDRKTFTDLNKRKLQSVLSEILVDPSLREKYFNNLVRPSMKRIEQIMTGFANAGQLGQHSPIILSRIIVSLFTGLFFLDVLGDDVVNTDSDRLINTLVDIMFDGLNKNFSNQDQTGFPG